MSKPSRLVAIGATMLATAVHASQPVRSTDTALVVGQVLDGGSGRPINGAIVSITGQTGGQPPRVLTSADGRFLFRGLRAGSYGFTASKAGYADGAHGRVRPEGPTVPLVLADGERNGNVGIRMWRLAAISGTLVDEAGERQVGVSVRAFRRSVVAGARRFVAAGSATTDDRGVYRIGGLIPGDYIVGTASRHTSLPAGAFRETAASSGTAVATTIANAGSSGATIVSGDAVLALPRGTPFPPATGTRLGIYPPAYHPFSPSGDGASVVTVVSGQEYESADLQISPVSGVRVSGFVSGPDGLLGAMALRLVPGQQGDRSLEGDWLTAVSDRNGFFTFPVVPAGQYSLRTHRGIPGGNRLTGGSAAILWADVPISVGTEDIQNLGIVTQPGLQIRGRVESDGTASRRPLSLSSVSITVEPVETSNAVPSGVIGGTSIDVAGQFTTPALPAGRYYVRVQNSPTGWMFLSATLDGRDVTDIPLSVTSDTPGVVVRFTDRWSGIQGMVLKDGGRDRTALVIVFPTDMEVWGSTGAAPRRMRGVRTGPTGEFNVNLPPGDYYVVAVSDEHAADWQDPGFLEAVSRGALKVHIGAGERRAVDLRTRPLR